MKHCLKTGIILLIMCVQTSFAGESLFGIRNRTLGLTQHTYASSGKGRSYEIAHSDSMQLNYRNQAAWTDIAYTIFSIKAGYGGAFSDTDDKSTYNDDANFQGGLLAFPIMKNKLVFGMSILPVTSVNQRVQDVYTQDQLTINRNLTIKGGLSRARVGFTYGFLPKVSLGLSYEYTFGKITENLLQELTDYTTTNILVEYDYRYTANSFVLSAFSHLTDKMNLGMVIRPSLNLKSKRTGQTESDALNEPVKTSITLPAEFSFGMEYNLSPRYIAGLDLFVQDWKNGFEMDGRKDPDQVMAYRVGMGIERKPSTRLFIGLTEQMAYRLGIFHGQLHYQKSSNPVTEYGLSMGLSLPIQRFRSGIDLSAIVGKRGSLSKNGLEETFISFDITINASELWFRNIEE